MGSVIDWQPLQAHHHVHPETSILLGCSNHDWAQLGYYTGHSCRSWNNYSSFSSKVPHQPGQTFSELCCSLRLVLPKPLSFLLSLHRCHQDLIGDFDKSSFSDRCGWLLIGVYLGDNGRTWIGDAKYKQLFWVFFCKGELRNGAGADRGTEVKGRILKYER